MDVLDADQRIIAFHQRAYDYLWDRWGIYLGTYRAALIVLGFADIIFYGAETFITLNPVVGAVLLIAIFSLIWFVFAGKHMGMEWNQQNDGDFERLNKISLIHHGRPGVVLRSLYLLIQGSLLGLLMIAPHTVIDIAMRLLAMFFYMNYAYSLSVLVREREPERFLAATPSVP